MNEDKKVVSDLTGIGAWAGATQAFIEGPVADASTFLGLICNPAAKEFGLLFRDKIGFWRLKNAVKIAEKTKKLLARSGSFPDVQAHPRVVWQILEEGSWTESDDLQDMWAGLLASSCTPDGSDDSNLVFVSLLKQLIFSEAKLLDLACRELGSKLCPHETLGYWRDRLTMDEEHLTRVMAIRDMDRVERELEHMHSLGLLRATGIPVRMLRVSKTGEKEAGILPTPLALSMYVKCKGETCSPGDYFHRS